MTLEERKKALQKRKESLETRYHEARQSHVFQFWPDLGSTTSEELNSLESYLHQLENLDINRVNSIYKKSVQFESQEPRSPTIDHDSIQPLPDDAFDSVLDSPEKVAEWRKVGLKAVAEGRVAVLLMAGGQGTRLGSSKPKGCYNIGLPSQKSLFQYQAERIARLQTVAELEEGKKDVIIPWYIMTSGPTRKDTEEFFASPGNAKPYFGLKKENVVFFEQGTLPCLSMEGQVLLDKPFAIAVAPDGNGGLYAATRAPLSPSNPKHTVLSDLASRGIDYIHAYSVDNCLVRVADPVFLGYSITKQADCAAKVVRKTKPDEAVGVVAIKDDKFSVVEYSEISFEQAGRRDASGELAFRAANIANHFYTASFLNDVESFEKEMAYHIALKKIPHVDQDRNSPTHGKQIKHTKPNGMKLELFVFDVFPFAKHMVVLEVDRKEEFSPLKNADATTPGAKAADSPTTSREDLVAQHKRYLEKAGAKVGENVAIEISPLVTYAGEGLEKVKGKSYEKSFEKSVEVLDQL